jgi:hypothetical protein
MAKSRGETYNDRVNKYSSSPWDTNCNVKSEGYEAQKFWKNFIIYLGDTI